MENSVLGNALEGVPEEEEEEKPKESNVDSAENIDGGKYIFKKKTPAKTTPLLCSSELLNDFSSLSDDREDQR